MSDFDPNPRFINHMCHWPAWAAHFRSAEGDTGKLAQMLGYACEEIDRLCKRHTVREGWAARLLYALVMRRPVPPPDKPQSMAGALDYIQRLNAWRAENPDRGEP